MNPKSVQLTFRIDAETAEALERARQDMGVITFSPSDTARELLVRKLRQDGFTKEAPAAE